MRSNIANPFAYVHYFIRSATDGTFLYVVGENTFSDDTISVRCWNVHQCMYRGYDAFSMSNADTNFVKDVEEGWPAVEASYDFKFFFV